MTKRPRISYKDLGKLEPPAPAVTPPAPEPAAVQQAPAAPAESPVPVAAATPAPPPTAAPVLPATDTESLPPAPTIHRPTSPRVRALGPEEPAAPDEMAPAAQAPAAPVVSRRVTVTTARRGTPVHGAPMIAASRPEEEEGQASVEPARAQFPTEGPSVFAAVPGSAPRRVGRDRSTMGLRFRDRVRLALGTAELLLFRVGDELFGVELSSVEEAIDRQPLHTLPEMPPSMLGIFVLREAMVALHEPATLLGARSSATDTVIVFRGGGKARRVALAIDDVEDVMPLELDQVREPPTPDPEGILLGVARRGRDLIGVLDAESLLAACRSDNAVEAA